MRQNQEHGNRHRKLCARRNDDTEDERRLLNKIVSLQWRHSLLKLLEKQFVAQHSAYLLSEPTVAQEKEQAETYQAMSATLAVMKDSLIAAVNMEEKNYSDEHTFSFIAAMSECLAGHSCAVVAA